MDIEKKIDNITNKMWRFTYIDGNLDSYYLMVKKSTRHRKYESKYTRLNNRESNIKENDVLFTDDIRKDALGLYFSKIKCLK